VLSGSEVWRYRVGGLSDGHCHRGSVNLDMDLHIAYERWGSISKTVVIKNLHYPLPSDIYKTLNEGTTDKIRDCRADDNNRVMGT